MSSTDKRKLQRLPMNLIQANVYAYTPSIVSGVSSVVPDSTYCELRNVETEDGIVQKLVEVDYPITADYVKSYEKSSNYKNDVEGSLKNASNGSNLGDVTALQELLSLDTSLIQEQINKITTLQQAQQAQQAQQVQQAQPAQSEVK